MNIYTIGHWHRSIDEFVGLLHEYNIEMIVDVRSSATSKASPQYYEFQPRNKETGELLYPDIPALPTWLAENGVKYAHLLDIGGHKSVKHIVHDNDGWTNPSFRSYADYCKTDTWKRGFNQLLQLAGTNRIAMMCGEPHPSRCHRSLLSDWLTANGHIVHHIIREKENGPSTLVLHRFGTWGAMPHVENRCVTYPSDKPMQMVLGL